MQISGRNKISAKVNDIKAGGVMSEVDLDIGGQKLCAVITNGSISDLGINKGDSVTAVIKATSVMLMK